MLRTPMLLALVLAACGEAQQEHGGEHGGEAQQEHSREAQQEHGGEAQQEHGGEAPAAPLAAPAPVADWIEVDADTVGPRLRAHPAPYLLVNLWSTWCEPCVEEMPELLSTARRYEDRGLAVVLISADPPSQREAALAFLREHQVPLPGWIKRGGDDAFIEALHPAWTGALPATLLLDRERRVVRFIEGPITSASLTEAIEATLAPERASEEGEAG